MNEPEPTPIRCASMHDPTGRRGVWFSVDQDYAWAEMWGGREGDDAHILLRAGETLTAERIEQIVSCLEYGAWMQEDHGPDCDVPHVGAMSRWSPPTVGGQ